MKINIVGKQQTITRFIAITPDDKDNEWGVIEMMAFFHKQGWLEGGLPTVFSWKYVMIDTVARLVDYFDDHPTDTLVLTQAKFEGTNFQLRDIRYKKFHLKPESV